jgi:TRAP-type uncharacterized transport system fused permease subunit
MTDATARLRSPRVLLACAWTLFQLYTAWAGMLDLLVQLPLHVAFAVALGLLTPGAGPAPGPGRRALDRLGAVLALACAGHYIAHNARLVSRMGRSSCWRWRSSRTRSPGPGCRASWGTGASRPSGSSTSRC